LQKNKGENEKLGLLSQKYLIFGHFSNFFGHSLARAALSIERLPTLCYTGSIFGMG